MNDFFQGNKASNLQYHLKAFHKKEYKEFLENQEKLAQDSKKKKQVMEIHIRQLKSRVKVKVKEIQINQRIIKPCCHSFQRK